jgi:Formate hydrogenlyase subunit 6/NADH:ubiquinone oxidoreductase 23 kD subunit (chain I)
MVLLPMLPELIKQLFSEPATNTFPAKYLPPSMTEFLQQVAEGKATLHPPVRLPPNFRGKIVYERDACTGCTLCARVCPSHAIDVLPETKRMRIWITQCIFCSQCTSVCPKSSLSMGQEFLLADEDRFSEMRIVGVRPPSLLFPIQHFLIPGSQITRISAFFQHHDAPGQALVDPVS